MALVRTAGFLLVCGTLMASAPGPLVSAFSDQERQSLVQYWADQVRYVSVPAGAPGQEWCVRLTPMGSKWIREVYKQFQSGKVVPTFDPAGSTPQQKAWVAWIDRQVQRDWAEAETQAAKLNSGIQQETKSVPPADRPDHATFDRKIGSDEAGGSPDPKPTAVQDPCPGDLAALVGPAPRFAAPVRPMNHNVTFPDGATFTYTDNVKVRPKYAYYRFPDGVTSPGQSVKSMPASSLESLIEKAGISGSEEKVMKAVSVLEGGFDSVNTYDTGFVSVGFIQFACLSDGSGSLGETMALYKSTNPQGFDADFHKYGIDVDGIRLVVVDPETGDERVGPDAALTVIHDKRLTAVFQRAGRSSTGFQVAQLQAAKRQFYPADDTVSVDLSGVNYQVRVGDVVKTEAGMATLMDRKVNTGKLAGLKESLEKYAAQYGLTQPSDLSDLEYVVTKSLIYRADYMGMSGLTKPRDNTVDLSRRGKRLGRSNGPVGDPASDGGGSRRGKRSRGL